MCTEIFFVYLFFRCEKYEDRCRNDEMHVQFIFPQTLVLDSQQRPQCSLLLRKDGAKIAIGLHRECEISRQFQASTKKKSNEITYSHVCKGAKKKKAYNKNKRRKGGYHLSCLLHSKPLFVANSEGCNLFSARLLM